MERGSAFCGSARSPESRKAPDPARQALRPGCEEHRSTDREGMPETEARPPAQNRRSGVPRGEHARSQGRASRLASATRICAFSALRPFCRNTLIYRDFVSTKAGGTP